MAVAIYCAASEPSAQKAGGTASVERAGYAANMGNVAVRTVDDAGFYPARWIHPRQTIRSNVFATASSGATPNPMTIF